MSPAQFGKEDLLALINADTTRHISLLQAMIRTSSPNPPGDTADAIDVVRKYLDFSRIATKTIAPKPESPNLMSILHGMADPRGTDASHRLVPNGHIDQFPVSDASEWERDPYSGDIEDGYVYGRSGVDMKAGTAASIIAFSCLHKLASTFQGDVRSRSFRTN